MEIVPYIIFDGNCEEALNFYAKAMGGEIRNISRYGDMPGGGDSHMGMDKSKIMHSHLAVGDKYMFMASDGPLPSGQTGSGAVNLSLNLEDAGQQDKIFNALAEGGAVKMPLQDTFWGARFGMLTDKYGIHWMLNHELGK